MMVLGIGIWASRKAKHEERKCARGRSSEVTMVGGRNLNIWVSIFTMTGTAMTTRISLRLSSRALFLSVFSATWVGGGYIMGCAEVVYNPKKGLVWAIAPIGFSANMILGE